MRALLLATCLFAGGCTSYHVEQNSRNGMASCAEKGSSGNLIFKKECTINTGKNEK